jgi:hypothetical protein
MADDEKKEISFDPEQYVMIARYLVPMEAQMAKGVLESASLECFLHGENANNLLAPAFRARLMVHKKDEDAARTLLDTPADGDALPETTDEEHGN